MKKNMMFLTWGNNGNEYIKVSEPDGSFMSDDFAASHPDVEFVIIQDIFVDKKSRHQGIGSMFLQTVSKYYGEDVAILTAAGASMKEYPEEPSDDEKIMITKELRPFYEKNGFIDVNKYYGNYEFKNAYLFNNKAGRECLEKIKKEFENK